MKLYTEEHLKEAYKIGLGKGFANITIEDLKPIELPSDEEIEKYAEVLYPVNKGGSMFMPSRDDITKANKQEGFLECAKWMKKQILNQNK